MIHKNRLSWATGVLIFTARAALWAQAGDTPFTDVLPAFQDKAVVLDITASIVENDREEVWNSSSSRVTVLGRAVGVRLVGSNIAASVQFTPYIGDDGGIFLLAQGQIWVGVPDQGIHYQSTVQTIPVVYGEEVYFLPLGDSPSKEESRIELRLNLHPYKAAASDNRETPTEEHGQN